jgi:hypothetical protein
VSTKATLPGGLAQQRCFNHFQREAVARCVECRQFFCRECVAEHDDRIVCATCLGKLARRPPARTRRVAGLLRLGQCVIGVILLWCFFYLCGVKMLSIPTSFHEGTLWQSGQSQ